MKIRIKGRKRSRTRDRALLRPLFRLRSPHRFPLGSNLGVHSGAGKRGALILLSAVLVSAIFLSAVSLFLGCSGKTHYVVSLDVLSFIPEEQQSGGFEFDAAKKYELYLFPFFEGGPVKTGVQIEDRYTEGYDLRYFAPETGDIYLTLYTNTLLENKGSSGDIEKVHASLFLAEPGSSNIYDEGVKAIDFTLEELNPGKSETMERRSKIGPDSPAYAILKEGQARIGLRYSFRASIEGTDVSLSYQLEDLDLRISIRPFSFIP